jgi:two-component sensor histidine kinase
MSKTARLITSMFVLCLAALAAVGFLLREAQQASRLVTQTAIVKFEISRFFNLVRDGEIGQRGFLLTNDEGYLVPYLQAKDRVQPQLLRVAETIKDNARHQARIAELKELVDKRFMFMEQTTALQRSGDTKAAIDLVKTGRGKLLMDRMRTLVADMQDEEDQLLAANKRAASQLEMALWTVLGFSFSGLAYAASMFGRQRAEFISQLESQIADRTKHLSIATQELTHRTKNLLAMVSALARQTRRSSGSLEEFSVKFDQRLNSISQSITQLTDANWRGANLQTLLPAQLAVLDQEAIARKIDIAGPTLFVNATAAHYIGLAIHELLTNAVKHGALAAERGMVKITWGVQSDRLVVTWREDGATAALPNGDERRGFGSDLLDRLIPKLLGGESHRDFTPDGLLWMLSVPIEMVTAQNEAAAATEGQASVAVK